MDMFKKKEWILFTLAVINLGSQPSIGLAKSDPKIVNSSIKLEDSSYHMLGICQNNAYLEKYNGVGADLNIIKIDITNFATTIIESYPFLSMKFGCDNL